jgi:hypothetical protein
VKDAREGSFVVRDGGEGPAYACPICGKRFERPRQVPGHVAGKHSNRPRLLRPSIEVGGLQPHQVGYLAGFLDGEGGIQITKSTREGREYTIALHPTVYFTNTNRQSIETMQGWLRTGSMIVAHQKKGYRDTYVLHVTGMRNIKQLLLCLLPHLIIKRRQAEIMLEYCHSRMKRKPGENRHYSLAELGLYTSLIQVNRKGGKSNANTRESDEGRQMPEGSRESDHRPQSFKVGSE